MSFSRIRWPQFATGPTVVLRMVVGAEVVDVEEVGLAVVVVVALFVLTKVLLFVGAGVVGVVVSS